jgi:hypothetical protein
MVKQVPTSSLFCFQFTGRANSKYLKLLLLLLYGKDCPVMKRKGVLIGAYVPPEMKEALKRRSQLQHRTLSQELIRILAEALGQPIPGTPDRRGDTSVPRRRATDPFPRRRTGDVVPGEGLVQFAETQAE